MKRKVGRSHFEPRAYSGELFYTESDGDIDVVRFIIRQDEVAFHLVTDWEDGARWQFSGTAKLVGTKKFVAENQLGVEMVGEKQVEGSESIPLNFVFVVRTQLEQRVQVEGRLYAVGESYPFAGELKRFKAVPI